MSRAQTIARRARMMTAVIGAVAASSFGLLGLTAPAASAKADVGWVQLAHLSPNTPAVDVYLYSFGDSTAQLVLKHVAYGTVSPFEQLAAGDYTVAMRLAGAPAKSKAVLTNAVDVQAGHAYTVAGMGPAKGLRIQIIPDRLTTPAWQVPRPGHPGVAGPELRHRHGWRFEAGLEPEVRERDRLQDGVPRHRDRARRRSSESATSTITLGAGTIHTLVILDDPGKLTIDDLLEAAGSRAATGGVQTGFGGTAAQPGATVLPWLAIGLGGVVAAGTGVALLSRRRRPALHARQSVRSA